DFIDRKHGRKPIVYDVEMLAPILKDTYGVILYQEQVMQIARELAGYSLGQADLLRRAMGKKKPEEMAKHRIIFAEGAAKNGIDAGKANEIFDLMEKFAGYGFNKSHAAAYALLAYHTAWAKVHYPAEFTAANMTVAIDDTDKLKIFHDDALALGVAFDPPDLNAGTWRFEPVDDRRVRYGLGAIKGTGQGAIEAIVEARQAGGPFTSLFDFCRRVDRQRVNKRVVEALVKAGAFDALHPERAALMASIALAFEDAETQAANADQGGLFDFGDDAHASSTREPGLVAAEPWSVRERLMNEKQALGFYLSGHLFDDCEAEVRRFARRRIADLSDSREPQLLAGIVGDPRWVNGQRGRVLIFKLDDKSDTIEAVANEDVLEGCRELMAEDALVIVQGKVQPDRFSGGLRLNVSQVWDLATARCRFGRYLRVAVNGRVPPVLELLRDFPPRVQQTEQGELRLGLGVHLLLQRERVQAELDLGDDGRFYPSDDALERWKTGAHGEAVVVYD
ncbi:MAG TPA: OB-fold nucleic acid binding domain-containing protein, partial [Methylibium sp.]|nr:OB-fold nucleic acid binding domain-containing protein [Methylibium sp.]